MLRVAAMVLVVASLVACTAKVNGPEVEAKLPGVKVEMGDDKGKFCPPGQAKKGHC